MLTTDAERLAKNKRGEYLDLLVKVDGAAGLRPPLAQRVDQVLIDARVQFPEPYLGLSGPVPWSAAVMVRIAYRGSRRGRLAELLAYLAGHPSWDGLTGELVRAPTQRSGIDTPEVTGLVGGMRLADRDLVPLAQYPPADIPPDLVEAMLRWAGTDHAARVYISTWARDRKVTAATVKTDLGPALAWTSDIAVVTFDQGTFRRVVFSRDCIMAAVSCRDEDDRRSELDGLADLFVRCRHRLAFAGVNRSGLLHLGWDSFLHAGASDPPYSPFWEDVADAPADVVPDAYALQLLTPAHAPLPLSAAWQQQTTDDGYRLIRARDPEPWIAERRPDRRALAAGRAEFDSIIARPINPPWTPRIHVHQSGTLTELRADVDGLAQGMTGQHLDLLARFDGARTVDPPLCERMSTAVADGRARFPEIYSDLSGPVPWSDDVMVRIAYRGSRRDKLAQMVTYLADHPVWQGLSGELIAVPERASRIDEPGITGLAAGLRLRDRKRVPVTYYDPAETPSGLVDAMLEWAGTDGAERVYLSMWSTDREVEATRLRAEVGRILACSSNLAVITVDGDVVRRVVFNRDSVIATVSCRDANRRTCEMGRFADLFTLCDQWVREPEVRESELVLRSWDDFLASGAEPLDTVDGTGQ